MWALGAARSVLAARPHGCRVPALLPPPTRPPGKQLRVSSAKSSSSDGAPESSDSEGGPAAATELARLRGRQAELDAEQQALDEQQGSLDARREALFEELEALAERERQLQSLLGSTEASGWSLDAAGSSGEERQQWGSSEGESDREWLRNSSILRAKWMLDGCCTLAECRDALRCGSAPGGVLGVDAPMALAGAWQPPPKQAPAGLWCREHIEEMEQMEADGWELVQCVEDDYGYLLREPPADEGNRAGGRGAAGSQGE